MTTRREFLQVTAATGSAFILGFNSETAFSQAGKATEVNAWIVVEPNDRVIIRYARSEMGQGSMTSAAQLVAEELECDWAKVRVEYAETNAQVLRKRPWGDMAAGRSRTIRQSQPYLRQAGATARTMLVSPAAPAWGVPGAGGSAAGGAIPPGPSQRKTSLGKGAAAAAKAE